MRRLFFERLRSAFLTTGLPFILLVILSVLLALGAPAHARVNIAQRHLPGLIYAPKRVVPIGQVFAQLQMTGAGKKAGSGYVGPVDIIGAANVPACYSVRGCWSTHVGGSNVMMNVQRTSDSQTCDLLITALGVMGNTTNCSGAANGTAPATFCGAGSGVCGLVIWYDQKANAANNITLISGAPGYATLVFNAFGTITALQFGNGVDYSGYQTTTFTSSAAQPWSVSTVAFPASGTGLTQEFIVGFGSCCSGVGIAGVAGDVTVNAGGSTQTVSVTLNALHNILTTFNGASSAVNIDGSLTTVAASPGTSGMGSTLTIGVGNGFNNPFGGELLEVIPITTNLSTGGGGMQAALCQNQAAWNGNGAACAD